MCAATMATKLEINYWLFKLAPALMRVRKQTGAFLIYIKKQRTKHDLLRSTANLPNLCQP